MARSRVKPVDFVIPFEDYELIALQMTADPQQNATPEQQAVAIKMIAEKIAIIDYEPYRESENDRDANFLSGRVFVGKEIYRQLRKLVGDKPSSGERK